MPEVLILTGPPGSGKSSVALALADRYDRVAHIQVDQLRHMVTPTGYIEPFRPGFDRQQRLAARNACSLAANFLVERFAVVIDDVIADQAGLDLYLDGLRVLDEPVHLVRLLPSLEVCLARNQLRSEGRTSPNGVRKVHELFVAAGDFAGSTLDSSADPSPQFTADRLQELTTSGASLIWAPAAKANESQVSA